MHRFVMFYDSYFAQEGHQIHLGLVLSATRRVSHESPSLLLLPLATFALLDYLAIFESPGATLVLKKRFPSSACDVSWII